MKAKIQNKTRGLTLVELLIIVTLVVVLVLVLLPALARPKGIGHQRMRCANNLKQVGLSYRLWANDDNGQFPFASTNARSSLHWVNSPKVFRHFQVMSNELVTPKILVCQSDRNRKKASDFTQFSNANLSYFVGLEAREDNPQSILSGDRNITGGTLSNGFLRVLQPTSEAGWTKDIHNLAGNVGLGDGSVQQVTVAGLRKQLAVATNAHIRLAIP
jgi:type II secretory pathway pseudopilin PulG